MVHIYNGVLLGYTNSMDEPRGYNLSEIRERQIPYDFTYMWNLKNKINTQTKQKQTHRQRKQVNGCQRGGRLGDLMKKVKVLRSTNW